MQPFVYDESHPYLAGQHRGIDIGADAPGEQVVAPAAGTVSFAGSVPTNGECVTIQTSDGYVVTLTHLGTILVAKGAAVDEGQTVGTIGPSGTPELGRPYVHLGIRTSSDPNGYLDPLSLLPPQAAPSTPAQNQPAVTQPSSSTSSASTSSASAPAGPAPSSAVAASTPSVATTRGSTVTSQQSGGSRQAPVRAQKPRAEVRTQRQSSRPASHRAPSSHRVRPAHRLLPERSRSAQRPVVEATAPTRPVGLDAGHELQPSAPVAQPVFRSHGGEPGLPLALNGVAALVALAAAFAAGRRRGPTARAQVLHLPRPGSLRRAA